LLSAVLNTPSCLFITGMKLGLQHCLLHLGGYLLGQLLHSGTKNL
jgi:hypothetical protein